MPRYKRKSVQQSKKDLKRKNDARDFESETVSKKAVYKLSSDVSLIIAGLIWENVWITNEQDLDS